MGADAGKAHETYTVSPAAPARMSDAVDVRDDRPPGATPLTVDADALDVALETAGVTVGPRTLIKLRLRAQTHPGEQGHARRLGPDEYRVVIHVADKPSFADHHLYIINNSVLCRGLHNRLTPTSGLCRCHVCSPLLRWDSEGSRSA